MHLLTPSVATILFTIGILGFFYLDRGHNARVSKALWLPTIWVMIACSRPVSMWLGMSPTGGSGNIYLQGSPIDRAVWMCLTALGLLILIRRANQIGPILRKNWPIVLFFAFAVSSILWSDYPFVTFKHWIKGVGDVMMVLVVLTEPCVTDAIERLVTRAGFVLLPLSVLFIKYYPSLGRNWSQWGGAAENTGVALQKNSLGEMCAVLGLGLLWRFRNVFNDREASSRSRRLLALGTVLGMVIWLLHMCNSLTSMTALAMAGGVMLLAKRPAFRRNPALVHIVIVAMLSVCLYALFFQSSKTLVQNLGRTSTLSGRTKIWTIVLSIPDNRLVGTGYETFWVGPRLQKVWSQMDIHINEAHDGYTEMLLNLGWVGVGLLGLLIATGYRNAMRAYRLDPEYSGLMMAFLLNAVITGFTEAAFRMVDPVWTFFLLATIAVPLGIAMEPGREGGSTSYQLELADEDLATRQVGTLVSG